MIRSLALWDPDARDLVVLNVGTTLDALEAGRRAVNATELLPGEDPALLTGPDRVDVYRVVDSAAAVAASR